MATPNTPALMTMAGKCVVTTGTGTSSIAAVPDCAAVSVTSRIPEFWTKMPRLWFDQFECTMAPQKQGNDAKFHLVISKLNMDILPQVSDILRSQTIQDKYTAVKERLIKVYEESAEQQFRKLVNEIELGDQKPSQLLRKMADLGSNSEVSGQTLSNLWLAKLPVAVRAGLAVTQEKNIEKLADIADKIVENLNANSIATVCTNSMPEANLQMPSPTSSSQIFAVGDLLTMINNLSLEVAALRNDNRGRSSFRGRRQWNRHSRSRSRSKGPKMTSEHPNWLCKYHYRYRTRAHKCEKPCAWVEKKEN